MAYTLGPFSGFAQRHIFIPKVKEKRTTLLRVNLKPAAIIVEVKAGQQLLGLPADDAMFTIHAHCYKSEWLNTMNRLPTEPRERWNPDADVIMHPGCWLTVETDRIVQVSVVLETLQ